MPLGLPGKRLALRAHTVRDRQGTGPSRWCGTGPAGKYPVLDPGLTRWSGTSPAGGGGGVRGVIPHPRPGTDPVVRDRGAIPHLQPRSDLVSPLPPPPPTTLAEGGLPKAADGTHRTKIHHSPAVQSPN